MKTLVLILITLLGVVLIGSLYLTWTKLRNKSPFVALLTISIIGVAVLIHYVVSDNSSGYSPASHNTSLLTRPPAGVAEGWSGILLDPLDAPYISNEEVDTDKLFSKGFMDHNIQRENLLLLKDILDYHGIQYFIDCGTLLGAVRDQGFIKGDLDADINMSRNDMKRLREKVIPELEQSGFISFRNSDSWMAMSLLRKGEYIDLYTHFNDRIPFELSDLTFLGWKFKVPKQYEEYLTDIYGDWKTPKNDHEGLGNWQKGMPGYVKKWGTKDMVVVTGACSNYADQLSRLIGSVHLYEPTIIIYVYDFGLNQNQVNEVKEYKNVIHKTLNMKDYPGWLSKKLEQKKRNGMKQAIKVLTIYELVKSIPNDVLWLDAGNQIGGSLDRIRDIIRKNGVYTSCMKYDGHMRDYTHDGMLKSLGLEGYKDKKHQNGHLSTSFFGVRGGTNNDVYRKVIKPAVDCTLKQSCIEPSGASLKNHRYDASLLSALLLKNNMVVRCGSSPGCPNYNDCMGVTACNSGQKNCPQTMEGHNKYLIHIARGGGPKLRPKQKSEERGFNLLRDIVNFRYKPDEYIKWVHRMSGNVDRSVDLRKKPEILSKFDYCVGDTYPGGSCRTVFCNPDRALTHSFTEIPALTGTSRRVLVVMGEDAHSSKLKPEAKKRIQERFSSVFWEANTDPDFGTLPMGLNSCYVAIQGTYRAERAILNAGSISDRRLLCVPAWNTFSQELSLPSAKKWASKAVGSRTRLGNFINKHKDYHWFDSKKWHPSEYYSGLSQYKFSVCPTGNGIQAPKLFEALLVRTIPVVEDELAHRQLVQLGIPLVIVQDWEDISPKYLSDVYDQLKIDWEHVIYLFSTKGVYDIILSHC